MNIDSDFLSFPFRDERWQNKLLIGGVVALVGSFIWPLVLPLWGYMIDIMRRAEISGELSLPEWDDWGRLFGDGLRVFVVGFVYMLPVGLLLCIGYGLMLLMLPLSLNAEQSPELVTLGLASQFVGFFFFALAMIPMLFLMVLMAVALTRMVAHESLGAAFQFGEVWRLTRRGFKHYALALVISMGAYMLLAFVIMAVIYSMICACLTPFLAAGLSLYLLVLTGGALGLAYRASRADAAAAADAPPAGV